MSGLSEIWRQWQWASLGDLPNSRNSDHHGQRNGLRAAAAVEGKRLHWHGGPRWGRCTCVLRARAMLRRTRAHPSALSKFLALVCSRLRHGSESFLTLANNRWLSRCLASRTRRSESCGMPPRLSGPSVSSVSVATSRTCALRLKTHPKPMLPGLQGAPGLSRASGCESASARVADCPS